MVNQLSFSEWKARNNEDNFYDYLDYTLSIPDEEEQEQGNENMDKKFTVMATNSFKYRTYEEAETEAKRYTARNDQPYAVAQAISVTKEVVPEIEVVKLKTKLGVQDSRYNLT